MAIDTTLVQGAYNANRYRGAKVHEAQMDIVNDLNKTLEGLVDKEKNKLTKSNEEYDSFVNDIVNSSELEGQELGALYDAQMTGRDKYLAASNKDKLIIRQEKVKEREDYTAFEELKEKFAGLDGDMSISFVNSEQGKKITEALSNPSKYIKIKDGRIRFEIDGELKTVNELREIVDGGLKDTNFANLYEVIDARLAITKSDYPELDYDGFNVRKQVMKYVNSTKNLNSLMNDELVEGVSFKESLYEALDDKTYENLGITPEMLDGFDTNNDDKLDDTEKVNLVNSLEANPKLLKEILGDFYTDLLRQTNGYDIKTDSLVGDNSNNKTTEEVDESFYEEEKIEEEKIEEYYRGVSRAEALDEDRKRRSRSRKR
jgi:hypothetical protein